MKKLFLILVLFVAFSCKPVDVFKNVTTELTYEGECFYHNGVKVAYLSSVELSWDDGRIVREYTFLLTDAGQNDHALEILKIMHEKAPNCEIEVELKK